MLFWLKKYDFRGDTLECLRLLRMGLNIQGRGPDCQNTGLQATTSHYLAFFNIFFIFQAAARGGHSHTVEALLDVGADSSAELLAAAEAGQLDVLVELLKAGVDTEHTEDTRGRTALIKAAEKGHPEILRLLLRAGAHCEHQDMLGRTALMEAAMEGHQLCVQELLGGGAKTDVRNSLNGRTALAEAAVLGNVSTVMKLVGAGAAVDLEDQDGRCPLGLASGQGHCQVVTQLLIAGAEVDHRDTMSHRTALMEAAMEGHEDIVKELLHCGANKDLEDTHGQTAQDFASNGSHSHILTLLQSEYLSSND